MALCKRIALKDGSSIAVDIDLAKFFGPVNHDVLMNLLGRTIADKRLLRLIGRYLRAGDTALRATPMTW